MCDGCGRGCNEFAKSSRAFQLSQKWPFLEIVKAAAGLDTLHCMLQAKDAIVGACHCTIHVATGKP